MIDSGFRIVHVPAATAMHVGGHSVSQMRWVVRQQAWYGSLLRYASKHYSKSSLRAVAVAVIVGCIARAAGRAVTGFSLAPFTACSRVVRLASLHLRPGERGMESQAVCSRQRRASRGFE
jgi:hypothetical protein